MAFNRFKSYAGTAGTILKALSRPVETLTASILSGKGILNVAELKESLIHIDDLKHQFASISSMISMFNIVISNGELIYNLTDAWSQLTKEQRIAIVSVAAVGGITAIYPIAVLGAESHTMLAGLSATASIISAITANQMTLFFAKKDNQDYSLLGEGTTVSYASGPVLR